MKITKRQLRRIIREEKARLLEDDKYAQLPQKGDPAEFARLKAQRDSARIPNSTAMGKTAKADELFSARDDLLGMIETLRPNEAEAYIDDLIDELKMMKRQM